MEMRWDEIRCMGSSNPQTAPDNKQSVSSVEAELEYDEIQGMEELVGTKPISSTTFVRWTLLLLCNPP